MDEAINAYHKITVTPEFRQLERMRSDARHNEASALHYARQEGVKEGMKEEREKWQSVVADKDAQIAELQAKLDSK
jgi:flagellar biosynthesis/type III secretory pathway protein FliH